MDRPKAGDDTAAKTTTNPTPKVEPDTAPAVPVPTGIGLYEPYPGAHFFHGGRNSPLIQTLAVRLQQEGHWKTAQAPGPDWTNAHKRAFASYQRDLRPKGGGDTSGIPDEVAWDKLGVPRVSPLYRKEG
ncbi:hypothetical protein E6R18_24995 [Streptomyces sp. A1277]|uniref:peptidoglycan-binding protein n=1 Tax=Streptomyces sp. A1277 TaxID=2563103 RepID=UPI0010A221D5|nr:peptidoglycan-binding protein [Streptomyces sp. A1277]THA29171.1 hypothetical protein E6R18_24995 [Streptomyces sp. A1277]